MHSVLFPFLAQQYPVFGTKIPRGPQKIYFKAEKIGKLINSAKSLTSYRLKCDCTVLSKDRLAFTYYFTTRGARKDDRIQ